MSSCRSSSLPVSVTLCASLAVGKQQLRAQTSIRPQVFCDFRQRVLSILFSLDTSQVQCCSATSLSPSLSLPVPSSFSHSAHLPLCSHMIYYNIFACAPPSPFSAAMFDLISSKLSSVSTENTSVSFPASLSVSALAPFPPLSVSPSLFAYYF